MPEDEAKAADATNATSLLKKKKKKKDDKKELTPSEEVIDGLAAQYAKMTDLITAASIADLGAVARCLSAEEEPLADQLTAALLLAVQANAVPVARHIVEHSKVNLNRGGVGGVTPVMTACRLPDSVDLLQYLVLERNAAVDVVDKTGATALFYATRSGNLRAVELLLQQGASVDRQNERDMTAAMVAAFTNQLAILELLRRHGANLALRDALGNTALHLAAQCGRVKVVRALVAAGAPIGVQNTEGKTASDLAVDKETADAVLGRGTANVSGGVGGVGGVGGRSASSTEA